MLLATVIALFSINQLYGSVRNLEEAGADYAQTQQGILRATVAFKQQSRNEERAAARQGPGRARPHWKAFSSTRKRAHAGSRRRAGMATEIKSPWTASPRRTRRRRALPQGLQAFKDGGFDPYLADKAVAGIDRAPPRAPEVEKIRRSRFAVVAGTVGKALSSYRLAIVLTVLAMFASLVALWFFIRTRCSSRSGPRGVRRAHRQGRPHGRDPLGCQGRGGQLLRALAT